MPAANSHSLDLEKGSSQYTEVSMSSTDSLTAMTVMMWVKPESLTANDHFAAQWPSGTNNKWIFRVDSVADEVICFIASSTSDDTNFARSTGMDIGTGGWKHIAFVYNGGAAAGDRIKFYADAGEKTATITGTIPTSLTNPTTDTLRIGSRLGTEEFYDGLIDEVRIYGSALSATQIADLMRSDSTTLHGTPLGYWKLNNDYADSSGNGLTLTASGSPVFSTDVPFGEYTFTPETGGYSFFM